MPLLFYLPLISQPLRTIRRACQHPILEALRPIRLVRGSTFLIRTARMATPITGSTLQPRDEPRDTVCAGLGIALLPDYLATVEDIAARHKCSVRHVNMTISMAFIAPGLVKAAVKGRLPRGIGVATLRDAPAEWSLQFERLGLAAK